MTVQYNKVAVDGFVAWMQSFFEGLPEDFVRFWEVLAFSEQRRTPKPIPFERFAEWGEFSLWEKQAVFFSLLPLLEKITAEVAKGYAARARHEEPL